VIEAAGIPTVSITLLRVITEQVRPPRALSVERPLGYPLGRAHDRRLQRRIILSALEMLSVDASAPVLHVFTDDSADLVDDAR
jgi:D-proline reductase (dithiol) PrdB